MKIFLGFVVGAASALGFLFLVEKVLGGPISFSIGEGEWIQFPEADDFVGGILAGEVPYFPRSMQDCLENRDPNDGKAFAEPTCKGLLEGLGSYDFFETPNGIGMESFDEIVARTVTPSAACSSTEFGFVCYRPFYFAKFHKAHFFAKPRVIADRAFFFTITINLDAETIVVDGQWSSSFSGVDDFPWLLPVGL